jgi:hypothetical protein
MAQSEFGELKVFEDFLGIDPDYAWAAGGFSIGGVSVTSVNEGSIETTVDEPGGIVAITTDTADNDNVALYAGAFKAADGPLVMETRFKYSNVDTSIFAGFTETLAKDTPVMPAEFATVTMTYNGTGAMAGMQYDVDGTTDDFRAVFGDAGVALTGNGADAAGTRANATVTADRWMIVRVEIDPNGAARCYFGDQTSTAQMKLIKSITGGIPTDVMLFPTLFCENRSGNARVLEVDYFYARGYRDWAAD